MRRQESSWYQVEPQFIQVASTASRVQTTSERSCDSLRPVPAKSFLHSTRLNKVHRDFQMCFGHLLVVRRVGSTQTDAVSYLLTNLCFRTIDVGFGCLVFFGHRPTGDRYH
jgi:hypothetical protein